MEPKIIIPRYISRKFIQSHSSWTFLYGHDYLRKGCLGQSWEFYDEPNTFPIFTAYKWCANPSYFSDSQDSFEKVDESFAAIPTTQPIIPCPKLGEGCSRLREFAPRLLQHIKNKLQVIAYPYIEIDYGQH